MDRPDQGGAWRDGWAAAGSAWAAVRDGLAVALPVATATLHGVLLGVADLLWPPAAECFLCAAPCPHSEDYLPICAACLTAGALPPSGVGCSVCCRPMGRSRGQPTDVCADCRLPGRPYAGVVALSLYREPLRRAILQLKFGNRPQLAMPLGRALAAAVQRSPAAGRCRAVLPVPLARRRQWQRGYNQAERLAVMLAVELGLPLCAGLLARPRLTPAQSGLSRQARLQNLAGAFQVQAGGPLPTSILLVDDVFTTGATAWAAAAALREAGCQEVWITVLAVSDRMAF